MSIESHHLHLTNIRKWSDLYYNTDLRFFKHSGNCLSDLLKCKEGHLLKIDSWDNYVLKDAYTRSKKLKHINLVKYICYFEYEEDIIDYLTNDEQDANEHNAIVIRPYYKSFDECPDSVNIIKQIILFFYTALYTLKVEFGDISEIYIDEQDKVKKISYVINGIHYEIKSKYIVKFDDFENMTVVKEIDYICYNMLYINIVKALRKVKCNENLITLVESFIREEKIYKVIDPKKILDTLLSSVSI